MNPETPVEALGAAAPAHALSALELFYQADTVVKTIMILLVLASVWSWGLIFAKLVKLNRLHGRARGILAAFQADGSIAGLGRRLAVFPSDPFRSVYDAMVGEWDKSRKEGLDQGDANKDSLKERVHRIGQLAAGAEVEHLQRGLTVLATVGSVGPFVGLFGTVWGIMNSFQGIAATNNTSLAVVAPGIAEALFATALGLVAAIPAVVAYNRAAGDVGRYSKRLNTLIGTFDVNLSRHLAAGRPLVIEGGTAADVPLGQPLAGRA
ncbi:MotA/TolQ/ExbB proton channel family protein [Zavarzinia compransoris]|uniref:Flagellar motor protein MotA n=1 Tax=Zavarzinia compransoris TaxID=1264899 RepID=A0A317DTU9_9PROT|nr:MotA/TolQ/ExbB proton channel family protein [Zavarzinia compransoris]PWR17802.1 flagellar motor protein MotA [Zavarzinia compransoris]TDP49335.1 biopolymer transport protein TolQ [Zavarzinia compransoris]